MADKTGAVEQAAAIAPVYIIGHLDPDSDTIAPAMGYAWLLRERDGLNAIAARAGTLNPQTAWVLKTAGLEAPRLIADASPRFERIARTLPPILPDRPLREAWSVAATSRSAAPVVRTDARPLGLAFDSYQDFGEAVLTAGAGFAVRGVETILNSDLKVYDAGATKFGIAQTEVADLHELDNRLPEIPSALAALCDSEGLALAVLMVTDVVRGASRLVLAGQQAALYDLPYKRRPDGKLDAPDVVSRNKQLLPAGLGLLS
jgi:inorganic pyrophosphatase/exopolyphosphatase